MLDGPPSRHVCLLVSWECVSPLGPQRVGPPQRVLTRPMGVSRVDPGEQDGLPLFVCGTPSVVVCLSSLCVESGSRVCPVRG